MLKFLLLFTYAGLLAGCGGGKAVSRQTEGAAAAGYRTVSAAEAHSMMSELDEYVLLDVRTGDEYSAERIEGAKLIPVDEIKERAGRELPDRETAIFVYCRSGRRSADASRQLAGMGYVNVYDFGGISGWPYGTVP